MPNPISITRFCRYVDSSRKFANPQMSAQRGRDRGRGEEERQQEGGRPERDTRISRAIGIAMKARRPGGRARTRGRGHARSPPATDVRLGTGDGPDGVPHVIRVALRICRLTVETIVALTAEGEMQRPPPPCRSAAPPPRSPRPAGSLARAARRLRLSLDDEHERAAGLLPEVILEDGLARDVSVPGRLNRFVNRSLRPLTARGSGASRLRSSGRGNRLHR